MTTDSTPRPGTAADLSHRLETLESGHAQLAGIVTKLVETQQAQGTDLQLIRQGQDYSEKLVNARFTTLETLATGANSKIDALTVYLQTLVQEASKAQADWKSTPAGKELEADMADLRAGRVADQAELRSGRAAFQDRLVAIEKRQYAMAVVVSAVVVVANIVGPAVIGVLGAKP